MRATLNDRQTCVYRHTEVDPASRKRTLVLVAIGALYLIALALPVMRMFGVVLTGMDALLFGWVWPGTISELANLALLAGCIAYAKRMDRMAFAFGLLALVLSLLAPVVFGMGWSAMLASFYVWLAASCVLVAAVTLDVVRRQQEEGATAASQEKQ